MYNLKRKVNMRLKLQFWKTPTKLSIGILDTEGLPIIDADNIKTFTCGGIMVCGDGKLALSIYPSSIGDTCSIRTNKHRTHIDDLVKNITNELFAPEEREVKVGDIVTAGGTAYYTLVEILSEAYFNRYIITSHTKIGKQEIVLTASNVE